MAQRNIPEINAGSMADIAFLLLIFFLVTTTMSVDSGITRKLPPIVPPDAERPEVKKRNVFQVLINKNNQLAMDGKLIDVSMIREKVTEFYTNPANDPHLSEQINIQDKLDNELSKNDKADKVKIAKYQRIITEIGPHIMITKGVISLQNDRGTEYGKYLEVQNEMVGAINDLRNGLSKKVWGIEFDLLKKDQQDLIKVIYPFAISEAEPRSYGK